MSPSAQTPAEHPEVMHLPAPSYWPLVFGAGFMLLAFGLLIGFMTQFYWVVAMGLALMLVATGGWLWSNIRERVRPSETPVVAAKFAMWCFIGTEVIIFGALLGRVISLLVQNPSLNDLLTHPAVSLILVSVNTFLLLTSSLFVVLGLSAIQHGNPRRLAGWLALTALLGAMFVSIQGYEYSKLVSEGFKLGASEQQYLQMAPAFYLLTGNHGLHVTIGVIWALVVVARALRGGFSQPEHMGVEIFGLYWHFVDVVWIMIFTLVYLV